MPISEYFTPMRTLASFIVAITLIATAARADVQLIGTASIPGDATDLSNLTDTLEDGTPHNRLGSFGSCIAYTGRGNRYIAVDDRGPSNGDAAFKCRFQTFEIDVQPSVSVKLVATTLLTNESGKNLVGLSSEFAPDNGPSGLRFDAEGVRVSKSGTTLFISDEYGPFVAEFDLTGKRLRSLPVPEAFSVPRPREDKNKEIKHNKRGRVTNKGFEGLALSPDGNKLYALLQAPLIQDHGAEGTNCRMLEIDLTTLKTRQFVVPHTQRDNNFNELLAYSDHEFLAIERDNKAGDDAKFKRIVKLDMAGATDVSNIASLPEAGVPQGVVAVYSHPFIDLLDAKFKLAGNEFPEKIEGLAFGPDLPDGRRVLVVTTDNDFIENAPNWFWVFAISPSDLSGAAH